MKTLEKNLQKIVQDYMNNLKKFIEKYNLDRELISDIDERIFEKINALDNPTRADIKNILHEIGTPEEIFREEIALMNSEDMDASKTLWQRFKSRTDKIIFLGTFYELGKITNIRANYFRAFFLFCILVLTPVTSGVILPILITGYFLGFLLLRTGFFRFIFSFGIGLFLVLMLIPAIILFGMYISDFHIENMHIFMGITPLFPIGMILGIFSLIVLALYFLRYTFTRKTFGIGFLLTGIISFVVAVSMGIAIIMDLWIKFSHVEEVHEMATLDARPDTILHISPYAWTMTQIPGHSVNNFAFYHTRVEPSNTDKIEIHYTTSYRGDAKDIEIAKNSIQNIDFIINDRSDNIEYKVEKDTTQKIPLMLVVSDIEIVKVPPFQKFQWFWSHRRRSIIEFEGSEKYNFMEKAKISSYCAVKFYNEKWELYCDTTDINIAEILARRSDYYLNELMILKKDCEIFYKNKNLEPNCASVDDEIEKLKNKCKKGDEYLCRQLSEYYGSDFGSYEE